MNERLKQYIEKDFDVKKVSDGLVEWINEWFATNGPESVAVVGLSGGKDSTLVATACVKALGKDRVFGVLMPDHAQADIDVSRDVAKWLGIRHAIVNVGAATDGIKSGIAEAEMHNGDGEVIEDRLNQTPQMLTNIAPRIRMTTQYAVAATMNGRVSNNSNRSERYVGYSTVFGDGVGDFSPISNLTVTEVIAVGEYLGIPDRFIRKAPSDGLTGKTDEDNFGFTYEQLDTYILTGACDDNEIKAKIDRRHVINEFKTKPMPAYMP